MREIEETASPLASFARELRRLRTEADLTQEQLGQRVGYSGALIGKVEKGDRAPSDDLAERCDEAFGARGLLVAVYELARRWDGGVYPTWFAGWMDRERTATSLCWWEPSLVPGLLQTADYARALFIAWQSASDDEELDRLVSSRMERQAILDRPKPPSLWVITDEGVLHRRIGNVKIMRDQLGHLADLALRPTITVQVVPYEVGAHAGLLGAFIIASGNGADKVYIESPDEGQTTELPGAVAKLTETFNILRGEALSRAASRELIMKVAEEQWT
jgi:transcriptional regulator with XRE-family HTH domain